MRASSGGIADMCTLRQCISLRTVRRHEVRRRRRQVAMDLEVFDDRPALVVAQQRPDYPGRQRMPLAIRVRGAQLFRCRDERVTGVVIAILARIEPESVGFVRAGRLAGIADVLRIEVAPADEEARTAL